MASVRSLLRVSYIPYDPNVWPSATADNSRHTRVGIWVWSTALYLLAIVAWVVWMKMPPKIQPPIALIPLADGTELRLVHHATGSYSGIAQGTTFGNRIRLREGATAWGMADSSTQGAWLVLTRFRPSIEDFSAPAWEELEIIEPGSPYSLRPVPMSAGGAPYSVSLFHTVPRRTPTLTLKFKLNGTTQQATIANPFHEPGNPPFSPSPGATAQAVPAAVPQQLEAGGFIARLEKVKFRSKTVSGVAQMEVAEPRLNVTSPHTTSRDFQVTYEWHDPTGNRVKEGVLPWSEPVWGLRVNVKEGHTFPVSKEQRIALGSFNVPGPGQIIPLKVPKEMKNDSVTDILLLGAGDYSWMNRQLTGRAKAGGPVVSTITANGNPRFMGGISAASWEIRTFSEGRRHGDAGSRIRVLKGEEICQPSSRGSSSTNNYRQEHLSLFRAAKTGQIQAGEPVAIEMFLPKTFTFEFLVQRPPFERATN